MAFQKLHERIGLHVRRLQKFVDRVWYPPFIGLLAALDNLVIIIPNDGILISSSMLIPKRWFVLAASVAVGSTLGALVLAMAVDIHGLSLIQRFFPDLTETATWNMTLAFFEKYGLLLVFAVAVTPLAQQPAVILAGLSDTSISTLAVVILSGRLLKYIIMAYIASHTPRLLKKLWGVKGELEEVGVKVD